MFAHDIGHSCLGRRIHTSGHSDSRISSNLGASSNYTWVQADTASAACPWQPGYLAITSMIFAAVIWDANDPCSVKTAQAPETPFTWHMSINDAKWTFLLSVCASQITYFLLLTFQIPCWDCLELFPFLVHGRFCTRDLHRLWHRNKLVHQIVTKHRSKSFSWSLGWEDSSCCLVDSWDSTIRPYIVLNSFSLPLICITFVILGWTILLHGMAGAIGLSNFFMRFWELLKSYLSSGSIK